MSSSDGVGGVKKPPAARGVGDATAPPGVVVDESSPSVAAAATVSDGGRPNLSRKRKWTWKKPKDRPKRPLSSYNFFFQHERRRILALGGATEAGGGSGPSNANAVASGAAPAGFEDMTREIIAQRWRTLDEPSRSVFEVLASADKRRHEEEMEAWRRKTSGGHGDCDAIDSEADVGDDSSKKRPASRPSALTDVPSFESTPAPEKSPGSTLSPNMYFADGDMSLGSTSSMLGASPTLHVPPSQSSASAGPAGAHTVSYAAGQNHNVGVPHPVGAAAGTPSSSGTNMDVGADIDPRRVAKNYERLRRIYCASVQVPPPYLPHQPQHHYKHKNQAGVGVGQGVHPVAAEHAPTEMRHTRDRTGTADCGRKLADSDEEFFSLIDSLPKQSPSSESDHDAGDNDQKGGSKDMNLGHSTDGEILSGLSYGNQPSAEHGISGMAGFSNTAATGFIKSSEKLQDSFAFTGGRTSGGGGGSACTRQDEYLRQDGNKGNGDSDVTFDESCKFEGAIPPPMPLDTTMLAAVPQASEDDDDATSQDDGAPNETDRRGGDRQHLFTPRMA